MRALVLAGGGSKGSYQSGALQYILGELEVQYDIFCGVSVGAINSAFLSMFELGNEKYSIKKLTDLWLNINSSNIYKNWFPFGKLQGLWKKSFFDSSPLHNLIIKTININDIRKNGKIVNIGAVSLSSGKYTIFDQNSNDFIKAVIASASFPGMLTPVEFDDQLWTDGGVKEMSPIKRAIDLGAIEIDAIITSPEKRIKHFIKEPKIFDILKRSLDLATDKILSNDIEKAEIYNKLVVNGLLDRKYIKLNIIRPKYNLTEDLLNFDPEKIKEMMKRGYQDAKNQYTVY